jgi:hypothetical protein
MDPAEPFSGYIEIPKQTAESSQSAGPPRPDLFSTDSPPDFVSAVGSSFEGARAPMWELKHERPWHRMAAFAFGLGATARDVARNLCKSEPAVQNLLRQPWFQNKVTAIMAEYGAKDIAQLFKAEQFNSLMTLVEIRDDPKAPKASRVVCARDILDRALGKPIQRVENLNSAESADPVGEVERLQQEVNRLKDEVM